jgi:acetolactate synthase-1/3 small subunit
MTILAGGDEKVVQQIIKQCQKLIDVLSIKDLKYDESITRELAVIVVKATNQTRTEIIQIASVFNARIADISETSIMIEVTGNQRQIDSIAKLLNQYGIEEMARTGLVALTFPSKRKPE